MGNAGRQKRLSLGDGGGQPQPDICPYATSASNSAAAAPHFQQNRVGAAAMTAVAAGQQQQHRCSTLGRLKNLEMTEYQKQKLINEANTVKIKVELFCAARRRN